jgi:hypothetical protein
MVPFASALLVRAPTSGGSGHDPSCHRRRHRLCWSRHRRLPRTLGPFGHVRRHRPRKGRYAHLGHQHDLRARHRRVACGRYGKRQSHIRHSRERLARSYRRHHRRCGRHADGPQWCRRPLCGSHGRRCPCRGRRPPLHARHEVHRADGHRCRNSAALPR